MSDSCKSEIFWILDSRAQLWMIIPCVSPWTVFHLFMVLCPSGSRCKECSCERQWSHLNYFSIYRHSMKSLNTGMNKGVGTHPHGKAVPKGEE